MSIEEAKKVTASFGGPSIVPPPRMISDVTAILDQDGRSPLTVAALRQADEAPPDTADHALLGDFYFKRGLAAREVGRARQEIADLTKAAEYLGGEAAPSYEVLRQLSLAELFGGNFSRALEYRRRATAAVPPTQYGRRLSVQAVLVSLHAVRGDLRAAETVLAESFRLYFAAVTTEGYRRDHFAYIAQAQAVVLETTGRLAEAEELYRRAVAALAADPSHAPTWLDQLHWYVARILIRQGRLLEAESEARTAVLGAVKNRGRDSPHTAFALRVLVWSLREQGRYLEAERLARAGIEIYERTGTSRDSLHFAQLREHLAITLEMQGRSRDALAEYERIRSDLRGDPASLDGLLGGHAGYAQALVKAGHVDRALGILTTGLAETRRSSSRVIADPAEIRAYRAQAYAARGDAGRALGEFREAMPLLLKRPVGIVDDDSGGPRAADRRLVDILGSYIALLASIRGTPLERGVGLDATAEAFRLADIARNRSVQRAVAASAARGAMHSSDLADLVRREQDARRELGVLHSHMARRLSEPSDRQDPKVIAELRRGIEVVQRAHAALTTRIEKDFPRYAELVEPKPVGLDQARTMLRPGEALIATLVTPGQTFVWAVPRSGAIAVAVVPMGSAEMAESVSALRRALEPRAKTLGEIPDFDVATAYRLFAALLEPVRSGWQDTRSLLIVGDGPLGQLPFVLLPTRSVTLPPESGPIFANYRQIPWLVRSHAVTMLPSVAALAALRSLPPADTSRRAFVGFGDPYFSREQAAAAETAERGARARAAFATGAMPIALRSSPPALSSAQLANLPRLPETADEIQSLAAAMNASPIHDAFLGARANEKVVKTLDLSSYRVIAFATHGLMPGDLDGLTQPALALSAPPVAGVEGDGLLTMDEIMALRLDADWVVLSACNTASGAGAGSEAISGLGRAFFYAGARALLVSGWPVETTSALALTTDLFRRQQGRPGLSRAEALQQTMNSLIERGEFVDAERQQVVFSYAHPIFWAPFALIGDGGSNPMAE